MIPPCRICGKTEWVAVHDPAHPERTICAECCPTAEHHDGETGHQFDYERGEGWLCRYCCTNREHTDFDYSDEDEASLPTLQPLMHFLSHFGGGRS